MEIFLILILSLLNVTDTNETAPMMESSEDEAKPSKYNPKHKSKEFIQDDSSSDEDFKATKDEPKKLNSSR
jgi:hypothetical protein